MTITIFGASGAIGNLLVKQALDEHYHVKAYVRNPDKITFSHPNLKLIKGELNDLDKINKAISGSEAVISTLGPSMNIRAKGYPILEGHRNILKAMEVEKVLRFITLATPSVKFEKDEKSVATIMPSIIAKLFLPRAYREIVQVGDLVKSSNLNWTIVRIISPTNGPDMGKVTVSFGDRRLKFNLSRADIARFMLGQVKDTHYIHSMPIIGG